jgi:hypothetical protein
MVVSRQFHVNDRQNPWWWLSSRENRGSVRTPDEPCGVDEKAGFFESGILEFEKYRREFRGHSLIWMLDAGM